MSMTFERTWQTYRMAERFMPVKAAPVTPEYINNITDIADRFDLVLLDAYGVLHNGVTAIDGALESFRTLREKGIAVYVVSNGPMHTRAHLVQTYTRMGYDFMVDEVSNSAMQVKLLAKTFTNVDGWALNGPEETLEWPHMPKAAGGTTGLVYYTSEPALLQAYASAERPIVVANPDVAAPVGDSLVRTPGEDAYHALQQNPQLPMVFSGKPYPEVFEAALAKFPHIDRRRVLMVGDTLHTDILGARHVGIQAMLVKSGLFKGRGVGAFIEESGITPEFVANHL